MEIILKGSENKLNKFLKSNFLFMKRHNIELKEIKELEELKELKECPKLTANEIADVIAKIQLKEDLEQYESDKRQIVVNAYKKKLKELE